MSESTGSSPVETISVRDLVTFTLRTGDLGNGSFQPPGRALAGTRAHQHRQSSLGPGWEFEVFLRHPLSRWLQLVGRLDALCPSRRLLEEIKTYTFRQPPQAPDPLHLAQARLYAWMLAIHHAWPDLTIRLCYLGLITPGRVEFVEAMTRAQLDQWATPILANYLAWAENERYRRAARNASIQTAPFPFGQFRPGQHQLSTAIYQAIRDRSRLFAQAPTGIGKTISALFPSVKAIADGYGRRIFYLTAKSPGRTVALQTAQHLRQAGIDLRCIALTARDKICFNQPGSPCDCATCPYAQGYYDRNRQAVEAVLERPIITRQDLREIGEEHRVCPFELGLDASLWCDLIIGDANYVLDPSAYLRRFFEDTDGESILLFDEAHNLPDRARQMFSATLLRPALAACASAIRAQLPSPAAHLYALDRLWSNQLDRQQRAEAIWTKLPEGWLDCLDRFSAEAAAWLALNEPAPFHNLLLQTYFEITTFQRVAAQADDRFTLLADQLAGGERLRLYCLDPSPCLDQALTRGRSAIFFSATLSPPDYYTRLLGGSGLRLDIASPFPPANLQVLVDDTLPTHFAARDRSLDRLGHLILNFARGVPGHVLVFFPSFRYLNAAADQLARMAPSQTLWRQSSAMDEAAREAYLEAFSTQASAPLLGLAVMGGIFGEGIDLVGDRLLGTVVVGVGLPQISLERDQIRLRFDQDQPGTGFDYAYRHPGWTRVLQAAGRLIRSPQDRGSLLLVDRRYRQPAYRAAFPPHWQTQTVRHPDQLRTALLDFWSGRFPPSPAG